MTLFLIALLAMVGIGLEGTFSSPETSYELQGKSAPPRCRPATDEELAHDRLGPHGKASTFQVSGFNVCERDIFEYGERNSFDSFITKSAGRRADEVAIKISRFKNMKLSTGGTPVQPLRIHVEVASDAPQLVPYLTSTFQAALVEHVPLVKIFRARTAPDTATLRVVIRRIDDPVHAIGVALLRGRDQDQQWVEL